jgi:hypothetical protein
VSGPFDSLLERFSAVSLDDLDERAALLRRVDQKYAVPREVFVELAERLATDHEMLEIGGRRAFAYRTTYFETPDLRCFTDHVAGRRPRYKARTRLYEDSEHCVFEVKLKTAEDETDKRQIDHPAQDSDRLTDAARRCLEEALTGAGLDVPHELERHLHTSFHRITLSPRRGSDRLTCDIAVRLTSPEQRAVELDPGLVLVETKTEHGDSPADRELRRRGIEPISLSKYRVGMSLVGDAHTSEPQPGSHLFVSLADHTGPAD